MLRTCFVLTYVCFFISVLLCLVGATTDAISAFLGESIILALVTRQILLSGTDIGRALNRYVLSVYLLDAKFNFLKLFKDFRLNKVAPELKEFFYKGMPEKTRQFFLLKVCYYVVAEVKSSLWTEHSIPETGWFRWMAELLFDVFGRSFDFKMRDVRYVKDRNNNNEVIGYEYLGKLALIFTDTSILDRNLTIADYLRKEYEMQEGWYCDGWQIGTKFKVSRQSEKINERR